jgi:uncharacterized RDD family membrane protein YckC
MKTHYEILGISQEANSTEIKETAQAKVNEIKAIFEVLSNADKRKAYDAEQKQAKLQDSKAAEMPRNYYGILAVSLDATPMEIKEAAQTRMNELKSAFEVLSKTEKRKAYDLELKQLAQVSLPTISLNRAVDDVQEKPQPQPETEVSPYKLPTVSVPVQEKSQPQPEAKVSPYKPPTVSVPVQEKSQPQPEAEVSPYKPPAVPLTEPTREDDFELAERGTRLLAYLVDTFLYVVPFIPVLVSGIIEESAIMEMNDTVVGVVSILAIFWVLAVIVINIILLYRNGQTIGKRLFSIKIVRVDGSRAGLLRIIFLRGFIIGLLTNIPYIGNIIFLVDALLIFQESRRCLHDLIADTIVIKAW